MCERLINPVGLQGKTKLPKLITTNMVMHQQDYQKACLAHFISIFIYPHRIRMDYILITKKLMQPVWNINHRGPPAKA